MTKQLLTIATLLFASATASADEVLSLSFDGIEYNEQGAWTGVFVNENLVLQDFVLSHTVPYGEGYFEGFIVSKNTDNQDHQTDGWQANQWGCMAQGGADENGEVVEGKPFLINYYSAYNSAPYGSSSISRVDGATFMPQGCYICNHPWTYYSCVSGDGFARPLEKGGFCKITIHGVNIAEGTTKSIDFFLATREEADTNGDGVINNDDYFTLSWWEWCDLTPLGEVDVIYLTMDSSDKSEYGMNTAAYVCIGSLSYKVNAAVDAPKGVCNRLYATAGNLYMNLVEAQEIVIYNMTGVEVYRTQLDGGHHTLSLQHLPVGVYLVRHGSGVTKIIR